MAAPTVGAVMADILPYLGVSQTFGPEEMAGKRITLEDFTGMTVKEAETKLKSLELTAKILGNGETVTAQLPLPGQTVPGGSQMLLYLGETPEMQTVEVPDFAGMTRQQAADTAGVLGLYVLVTGNTDLSPSVTVTAQSLPPKKQVPVGTTITLTFTDSTARDG